MTEQTSIRKDKHSFFSFRNIYFVFCIIFIIMSAIAGYNYGQSQRLSKELCDANNNLVDTANHCSELLHDVISECYGEQEEFTKIDKLSFCDKLR